MTVANAQLTQEAAPTPDQASVSIPVLPGLRLQLRVLPTAWLLIAVHLVVTATRLARSWWWQDDLNLLAVSRDLTPGVLLTDYNSHLVPGTFVIGWLTQLAGPLAWWPAALITLLLVAACDVALLGLLRLLFGVRPGILLPLGMFCGTTLTLTSTVWWAAAMQWLPVMLSLLVALYGHVAYLSRGRVRYAGLALAAVAFGLAFFEKALTTPMVLGLFTVFYGTRGSWPLRPWRAFLARPAYWLAQVALAGGFIALYLARTTLMVADANTVAKNREGLGDYVTLVRYMLLESFVPSLLGGPLHWWSSLRTTVNAWPDPSAWFAPITWIVALAVVVATVRARRGAWRAWALLGAFLTVSVVLVIRARLDFAGPFIGRDHRYLSDAAVVAAICLGLALMPLRPGLDRSPGRRTRRAPAWLRSPAVGLAAVLVMTLGGIASGETFMRIWTQNPTQPYFDNLRASLAAGPRPHLFLDEHPPDLVMTPTFEERRLLQNVVPMLDRQPVFGPSANAISTVLDDGRIVPATVDATPVQLLAPACANESGRIVVRLPEAVGDWRWKIQLGYLSTADSGGDVRLGLDGDPVPVSFTERLGNVYVDTETGPAQSIVVDNVTPGSNVCIGTVAIGKQLKPLS